jgi:hypothetical protein
MKQEQFASLVFYMCWPRNPATFKWIHDDSCPYQGSMIDDHYAEAATARCRWCSVSGSGPDQCRTYSTRTPKKTKGIKWTWCGHVVLHPALCSDNNTGDSSHWIGFCWKTLQEIPWRFPNIGQPPVTIHFLRVSSIFIGFYRILSIFTGFYRISSIFKGF